MTKQSQSTREIILDALTRSKDLTAHDLSLECGIGEPAVRFHLRKLKEAGVLSEYPIGISGIKAGRKPRIYRRIIQDQTGNVGNLCKVLLQLILETTSNLENKISHTIAEGLLENRSFLGNLGTASLLGLIGWLNQHQYSAGWEAGKSGPVIRFQNCPYRSIRAGNEILCKIDVEILQKLSGVIWEQREQLNWETLTGECVFVVKHAA